jgi:hypothetical protein
MTEQEIQELARHRKVPSWVIKLVADAVAHEREACAKECDIQSAWGNDDERFGARQCAIAIRSRSNL